MNTENVSNSSTQVTEPVLTICIPSYNRGRRVRALVDYLLPTVKELGGQAELLVVNNCSTDETEKLLAPVQSPHYRCHHRHEFLPTAEENMFASVELCRGRYIWFCGDDDIPQLETVRYLLELLRSDSGNLFFFNAALMDERGGLLTRRVTAMNAELVRVPVAESLFSLGLTFSFAGLSNMVLAKRCLNMDLARVAKQRCVIYSHVAWILGSFVGQPITIVNRPLVLYRNGSLEQQEDHFEKVARRLGVGNYHFWGIGLLNLLGFLLDQGTLTASQVARIWETRRDGTRYRLLDDVVFKIFQQLCAALEREEPRNDLDLTALETATNRLLSIDPIYFDTLEALRHLAQLHAAGPVKKTDKKKLMAAFHRNFAAASGTGEKITGFLGFYQGFEIYRACVGLIAFAPEHAVDRQHILSCVDPMDSPPKVYSAHDLPGLREKIDQHESSGVDCRELVYSGITSVQALAAGMHAVAGQLGDIAGHYRLRTKILRVFTLPVRFVRGRIIPRLKWFAQRCRTKPTERRRTS